MFVYKNRWREVKEPENISDAMQCQGVLTIHSR